VRQSDVRDQTLVGTRVRRTWQIAPEPLHLLGRHWHATLERAVAHAATGFGLDEPDPAGPYKLLIYDEGSFFLGPGAEDRFQGPQRWTGCSLGWR
jgi:hypothetical protein